MTVTADHDGSSDDEDDDDNDNNDNNNNLNSSNNLIAKNINYNVVAASLYNNLTKKKHQ